MASASEKLIESRLRWTITYSRVSERELQGGGEKGVPGRDEKATPEKIYKVGMLSPRCRKLFISMSKLRSARPQIKGAARKKQKMYSSHAEMEYLW